MATPAVPAESPEEPAPRGVPLHRRITFALFALLLLLAVVFYVYWGLAYDGWFDNGVYSVTIVLALFGIAGMWLVTPYTPVRAPPVDASR